MKAYQSHGENLAKGRFGSASQLNSSPVQGKEAQSSSRRSRRESVQSRWGRLFRRTKEEVQDMSPQDIFCEELLKVEESLRVVSFVSFGVLKIWVIVEKWSGELLKKYVRMERDFLLKHPDIYLDLVVYEPDDLGDGEIPTNLLYDKSKG